MRPLALATLILALLSVSVIGAVQLPMIAVPAQEKDLPASINNALDLP